MAKRRDRLRTADGARERSSAYAYAFDLLAHDGDDMRSQPLADRKAALAKLLRTAKPGIRYANT